MEIQKNKNIKIKKKYTCPEICIIKIDNEISLVMMSANPEIDPDEAFINTGNYTFNPFNEN